MYNTSFGKLNCQVFTARTTKDLSQWRLRIAELNNGIALRTKERDALGAKGAAAEVLLGKKVDEQTDDRSSSELAALRKAITELMEDGKTRKPRDMRRDLIAGGMDPKRVSSMTGNFYNAISRLTQDGILIRSGAKYSRAEKGIFG